MPSQNGEERTGFYEENYNASGAGFHVEGQLGRPTRRKAAAAGPKPPHPDTLTLSVDILLRFGYLISDARNH